MTLQIESFLGDSQVNVVEFYIMPPGKSEIITNMIKLGWDQRPPLLSNLQRNPKQLSKFKEFNYRDLVYSFDMLNDHQKVISRNVKCDAITLPFYVMAVHEDSLPTHRFPSTMEATHDIQVAKTSYKINSRMHLIHDHVEPDDMHYVYIRYAHSLNVDISKNQADLDQFVLKIT